MAAMRENISFVIIYNEIPNAFISHKAVHHALRIGNRDFTLFPTGSSMAAVMENAYDSSVFIRRNPPKAFISHKTV